MVGRAWTATGMARGGLRDTRVRVTILAPDPVRSAGGIESRCPDGIPSPASRRESWSGFSQGFRGVGVRGAQSLLRENSSEQPPLPVLTTSFWCCLSMRQVKGLDADSLLVTHIQVNRAIQQRRRTYRAHGRINRK